MFRKFYSYGNCYQKSVQKFLIYQINIQQIQNVREFSLSASNHQKPSNDKSIPKLIYIQSPWKYFRTKFDLIRLKLFWDKTFNQREFLRGTKQAVVVLTNLVSTQNVSEIRDLTTPLGFRQISNDMMLSGNDPRLQLLKFRFNDIVKTIPVRVHFVKFRGTKHCVIDMFFVAMRNVMDSDPTENLNLLVNLKKYDELEPDASLNTENPVKRIIFAEIFTRFYREYRENQNAEDWNIAFYKVATFEVLGIK